tara:strand:- start:2936 stop:3925 length:990 start_codon:yes stop_codon:yes gene_type:complete
MNYKVMNRPMFKMGGSTTPRKNFKYGTYEEAIAAIPAAFEKRRSGLENRKAAFGPLALYNAVSKGALSGVNNIGDLAMAFGSPEVTGSVAQGLMGTQKVEDALDNLDLTQATSMAKLLKPSSTDYIRRKVDLKSYQEDEQKLKAEEAKLDKLFEDKKINSVDYKNKKEEFEIAKEQLAELKSQTFRKSMTYDDKRREIKEDYQKNYGISISEEALDRKMKEAGYASGGRVGRQMGSPMMGEQPMQKQPMQEQPMQPGGAVDPMAEVSMQQEEQDPYTYLRSRLPQEIPDEVVKLIAFNKNAFADFADIQSQEDVDSFNQRYNVELVIDV